MPHTCSASSCTHRSTIETRSRGITFHRFPKNKHLRKKWEAALRRTAFTASQASRLCSEHFRQEDFDRTGQTVRLRDGVIPSVFSFSAHVQAPVEPSLTSVEAQETPSVDQHPSDQQTEPLSVPIVDHTYALSMSPGELRTKLNEALARVEILERQKRNAKDRERRLKNTLRALLGDMREKNLITTCPDQPPMSL